MAGMGSATALAKFLVVMKNNIIIIIIPCATPASPQTLTKVQKKVNNIIMIESMARKDTNSVVNIQGSSKKIVLHCNTLKVRMYAETHCHWSQHDPTQIQLSAMLILFHIKAK